MHNLPSEVQDEPQPLSIWGPIISVSGHGFTRHFTESERQDIAAKRKAMRRRLYGRG